MNGGNKLDRFKCVGCIFLCVNGNVIDLRFQYEENLIHYTSLLAFRLVGWLVRKVCVDRAWFVIIEI